MTKTITSIPGGERPLLGGAQKHHAPRNLEYPSTEDAKAWEETDSRMQKRAEAAQIAPAERASSRHQCPLCPIGVKVKPNAPFVRNGTYCWSVVESSMQVK